MDDNLRFKAELKEQAEIEKKANTPVCGTWIFKPDGIRGVGMTSYQYKCRKCQTCMEEKAKKILGQLAIAKAHSPGGILKHAVVSEEKAKEVIDTFKKHNVLRIAQEDGTVKIWVSGSVLRYRGQEPLAQEIAKWETVTFLPSVVEFAEVLKSKPENTRISGALGRLDADGNNLMHKAEMDEYDGEPAEDPRQFQFFQEAYSFKTKDGSPVDGSLVESAWNLAVADTADFAPTTIEEKQKMYNKRKNRFLYYMLQWGYKVAHRETHSHMLTAEQIGWDVEGAQKIRALYSNFLKKPDKLLTELKKAKAIPV